MDDSRSTGAEVNDETGDSHDQIGVVEFHGPAPSQSHGDDVRFPLVQGEHGSTLGTESSRAVRQPSSFEVLSNWPGVQHSTHDIPLPSPRASARSSRPWTDTFFRTYGGGTNGSSENAAEPHVTLPEYHHLPDDDFLEASRPQRGRGSRGAAGGDQGRGRGKRRGRRGYKWALRGTDHADLFKTPRLKSTETKRRGRGRGGGSRRGKKKANDAPEPSDDFKRLQSQATLAWMDGDLDNALNTVLQAIQADPEIPAGHALLYRIHVSRGNREEAALALRSAAISRRDPSVWVDFAKTILEANGEERTTQILQEAIDCYAEAIKLEKDEDANTRLRLEKLRVYHEMGHLRGMRLDAGNLLKRDPSNMEVVHILAQGCIQMRDPQEWERARNAYQEALACNQDKDSFGDPSTQWDQLDLYLHLVEKSGTPQEGLREGKRLARWFLGRKDETFWDNFTTDDREFDVGHERRAYVVQFQRGLASRDFMRYGEGLPIDIRVRLGVFRAKMGFLHRDEAMRHLGHLLRLADDIELVSDLFLRVAEALKSAAYYEGAISFYEPLKSTEMGAGEAFLLDVAGCYAQCQRHSEAESCFLAVIDKNEQNAEARYDLAKLYETMGQHAKAIAMTREAAQLKRRQTILKDKTLVSGSDQPAKKKRKMSIRGSTSHGTGEGSPALEDADSDEESQADDAVLDPALRKSVNLRTARHQEKVSSWQHQGAQVQDDYAVVKELWPVIAADSESEATERWIDHARSLTDAFRAVKSIYPSKHRDAQFAGIFTRHHAADRKMVLEMENMEKRLQQKSEAIDIDEDQQLPALDTSTPGDFHNISFEEWHRIFCDLALLYARRAQQDKCYDLLTNGLMRANVFSHNHTLLNTTLALCIYCAMLFNDSRAFTDAARQYIYHGDHRSGMANQLFAAASMVGAGQHEFDNLQQWQLRVVKMQDYLFMPPEIHSRFEWGIVDKRMADRAKRLASVTDGLDAQVLTTYAHITGFTQAKGTSSTALPYLFRALALQPENIVINLSIATAFVLQSMQKFAGNRQYNVSQGLSFLYRYYDLRVADGKICHLQEAEFNVARMWHLLGLTHLAVPHYEKTLTLHEGVQREHQEDAEHEQVEAAEDYSMEAALALQSIFVQAGNREAARDITERWLVM